MEASSSVQYYPWPSTVNVSNFISTKLWFKYPNTNYEIWREQMLCLIEGQDLFDFIDGSIPQTNYVLWRRSDGLLKGWILGSLHEDLLSQVAALETSSDVWWELESRFSLLTQRLERQERIASATERNNAAAARDLMEFLPLHKAALKGDWESANRFFQTDPDAMNAMFDSFNLTPLHVAVGTGKAVHFVRRIVDILPDNAIAQTFYANGETALHFAAAAGNVDAARILVNRMPDLLYRPLKGNVFPIQTAAIYAQRRMVDYLFEVTNREEPYDGMAGLELLISLIRAEFFDIALNLVTRHPDLLKLRSPSGLSALSVIAENNHPFFPSEFSLGFRQLLKFYCDMINCHMHAAGETIERMTVHRDAKLFAEDLCEKIKLMTSMEALEICTGALITAARVGNSDLVEMIIDANPKVIDVTSDSGGSIFHVAVENRSERVFNLVYQMSDHKHRCVNAIDYNGNTMLHAAGKLAPAHKLNQISGAALQFQRELQWYKEVEKLVLPEYKNRLNKDRKTPPMVFTEEHKRLKEEGEKWMKDTAASCSIAAALILTIMFAAAITVPGDYDNATGFPKFSQDGEFIVFGVSNAISLFTSTTSLLMFLSIFTSRYAEEDFLYALPKRLITGLASLFLSVLFMMVAFIVTIYLVVGRKKSWVICPLVTLAHLPIISFVRLQYPLLADLFSSTYGRGIFGKQSDRPFY